MNYICEWSSFEMEYYHCNNCTKNYKIYKAKNSSCKYCGSNDTNIMTKDEYINMTSDDNESNGVFVQGDLSNPDIQPAHRIQFKINAIHNG